MKLILSMTFALIAFSAIDASACQIPPCPGWGSGRTPNPPQPPRVETEENEGTAVAEELEEGASLKVVGGAAEIIYNAMTEVNESRSMKRGEQISCRRSRSGYECDLEITPTGEVIRP
jgi:hypothetical protein